MFLRPDNLDLKKPHIWLATWFGSGFMYPAPGTWGSLAAIPPALVLFSLTGIWGFLTATILVTVAGFWAAPRFAKDAGGETDSSMIVIDEVAGQWIAFLPVFYFAGLSAPLIALAFALFRLFDITKPWPVSYFDQRVQGAAGVMGDDIAAGLIAALAIMGARYAGLF